MSGGTDKYSVMRIDPKSGGGVTRYFVKNSLGRQVFGHTSMSRITRRLRRRGHKFKVLTHSHAYPNRTNFSPHFTKAEFACHDPQRTPVPVKLRPNARRLAIALEMMRFLMAGTPIGLNSVYRTPAWNAHVNGAKYSQHMSATAADINVNSHTRKRFIVAAKKVAAIHGIGIYPWGGLHVDVRSGVRVFWNDWGK